MDAHPPRPFLVSHPAVWTGICKMYEAHLKALFPHKAHINYEIQQLFDHIGKSLLLKGSAIVRKFFSPVLDLACL